MRACSRASAPLLATCESLRDEAFDGVFHLASAVSGECEADFDLGLRSNLDSTRALLDALRHRTQSGAAPTRLVFSSSVAVFGPDPAVPLPAVVGDTTLPAPQTSYGVQKLICEHLVADYTRKGYIDGRAARLMTVTVRPGRPNGAASSFFSGIIREPLAGEEAICPVAPDVSHPVTSPQRTVEGLIAVYEASREAFGGRTALNLPALNVTVQQMLDALEAVAGPAVRARVRFERDERIAGIVANWPHGATRRRAPPRLGLLPEANFEDIIRQYIADSAGTAGTEGHGMNQIDLKGRVAVVTGGAQGSATPSANACCSRVPQVVLWDIDAAKLDAACAALSALGPVRGTLVELTDDAAVAAATATGRPHRHPGQQRRHHRRQWHHLGAGPGGLAAGDRGQPDRPVPDLPRMSCRACWPAATAASSTSRRWPARKATRTPPTTAPARRR